MDNGSDIGTIQKSETYCFLLTDPAKHLTKTAGGAYMTGISRSGSKKNAIQNPSKKVLHISKTHNALVFIKLMKDVVLSPVKSYVSFCVTYLIPGDEDQTIPIFHFERRYGYGEQRLNHQSNTRQTDWTAEFISR